MRAKNDITSSARKANKKVTRKAKWEYTQIYIKSLIENYFNSCELFNLISLLTKI